MEASVHEPGGRDTVRRPNKALAYTPGHEPDLARGAPRAGWTTRRCGSRTSAGGWPIPARVAATTPRRTSRARCSSTWTRDLVGAVRPGPPSPPLPGRVRARGWRRSAFDDDSDVVAYDDAGGTIAARLWWMLDDLGHRPGPRARRRHRGVDRGRRAADGRGPVVPPPGGCTLRDALDADDRPRRAASPRLGYVVAASTPGRRSATAATSSPSTPCPATSRRRVSRPTAGNLGPDGRFLDAGGAPGAVRGALGADVVTSLRAAASPRATTRSRCGSRGCPIRSSTRARTATGRATGMPVATGDEPGEVPTASRALSLGPGRSGARARSGADARARRAAGRRPARARRRAPRANPIARSPSSATWNPNSVDLRPDREPEPVPDQVERQERRRGSAARTRRAPRGPPARAARRTASDPQERPSRARNSVTRA